jgi:hypothetical protein
MKTHFLTLATLLATFSLKSQSVSPEVLSSAGGVNQSSGGSIEWTIGEPVSDTYTSSNHIATMGFHQPELSLANAIKELRTEGEFMVYPNPVQDELKISFDGLPLSNYRLTLSDMTGRIISTRQFTSSAELRQVALQVQGLAQGNYLLHVSSSTFSKSVKINKVQ